ncbi:MAG TPA: sortase [Anaerolineales bacterium]|nr:sortase [Anaerolineales bacterium]
MHNVNTLIQFYRLYNSKYLEGRSNEIVAPNDVSAFRHEERPWLTLVTCREYDEKTDSYRKRVIVRAVLVRVTDE